MTKAIFDTRQPEVSVTTIGGVNWFQICLNEEKIVREVTAYPGSDTEAAMLEYQYDFNSWHDSTTKISDVQANPEKYLNYVPVAIKPEKPTENISARITAIEVQQEVIAQALQDMILGGE